MKKFSACLAAMLLGLGWAQARPNVELNTQTALPLKVRSYLNQQYRGWKLTSMADGCSSEFRRAVATGDFDGDGRRDYLLKFIRGRKGYILALLERRNGYEAHVLESMSAAAIKSTGISVFRKGERMPMGDAEDPSSNRRLTNDAPFDGPCESDAGGVHVYQNGRFN